MRVSRGCVVRTVYAMCAVLIMRTKAKATTLGCKQLLILVPVHIMLVAVQA